MTWNRAAEQGNEAAKCKWDIVPFTRGKGLDIGCASYKPFPHFIGVDDGTDARLFGSRVTPDVPCDARNLYLFADASMDFVFSSHTLEHIEDYKAALAEWWRVVKVGGNMVLYLPHKDFYPNIGEAGANPDHKHDFLPEDIIEAMTALAVNGGWNLMVNEERDNGDEYSFLQVYKKRDDPDVSFHCNEPRPPKTCAIFRLGGWGDVLQLTSILPGLKEQGFHISVITHDKGAEVLRSEPLIDEIILQDLDQIPNHLLGEYWAHVAKKYDRFINLSETVEHQFLAMSDRAVFHWPQKARHAVMNHNYSEVLHYVAQVPWTGAPESRFVATDEERKWAQAEKAQIGGNPLILWAVTGSAINKLYTHIDEALDGILKEYPAARIVTVGDENCRKIIESAWEGKQGIVRRAGVWSIRETMAFAKVCDLVIGPETGVLNSVAMESVQKIVMLSHSSVENLTRDWLNTASLHSNTTACHPCHKMIRTWADCVRHDTGTAACMAAIPAALVVQAVRNAIPQREELAA